MTGPVRVARSTPVSACEGLLEIGPLLVERDVDIIKVLRLSAARPSTRVVGVIDAEGKLVGILPILRIAEAVIARVMPEALLADIIDVADVARFGHAVESETAADAMLPPASVLPTASIADAFRVMHARHVSGLYVVDGGGRPTGYIDLLELAYFYLEALPPGASPEGGAPPR